MEARSAWIKRIAGYAFAAIGLVWVLHDVDLRELSTHLIIRNWSWAAAAVAADVLAFLAQGWRWSLLLSTVGPLRPLRATQAIYAGLFTNEVLPLHIGELVRAYLASRWLNVHFMAVLPSIAVERLLDGVWLALGIGVAALLIPLPRSIENAVDVFGIVVLLCVSVFVYLVYSKSAGEPGVGRFRFLIPVAAHFRQIVGRRVLGRAAVVSLLMIGLQAVSFWMVMPAFGLSLSLLSGIVIFLIVHIGTAIPNAPGNIGSYQFFAVVGLTLFGVDKPTAAGFSFVVFFLLTVPLWIIGFFALSRTGMSFGRLQQEIRRTRLQSVDDRK